MHVVYSLTSLLFIKCCDSVSSNRMYSKARSFCALDGSYDREVRTNTFSTLAHSGSAGTQTELSLSTH
jgi:hypothetical protein